MKKICINCGNVHNGGGVQVATSFIYELVNSVSYSGLDISINISNEVRDNLKDLNCDLSKFSYISHVNTYGLSTLKKDIRRHFSKFDIIFTIFGPDYLLLNKNAFRIVGFAQPWIVYPYNEVYGRLSIKSKIKNKIKFYLQKKFFKQANHLIVEIEFVKKRLSSMPEFKNIPIDVVHNSLASLYTNKIMWNSAHIKIENKTNFSIGFLGRDYLHKNTNILPLIKKELSNKYSKDVSFYVTLTEDEWNLKPKEFKSNINNIGSLTVSQCPNFYEEMDAIIFPSLLECFSATPLEAMAMEKPLFASDRDFVRDVCHDYAFYFDPLDPVSAVNLINDYIDNKFNNDTTRLKNARSHALNFSSPKQRAEQYLNIIRNINNVATE